MSFNGLAASFLPFTINGLTDATFSNSILGNAIATTLQLTSATPLKLARFNADRELVSGSVDESQVALLVGNNVFNGSQTILPGSATNINNVIKTAITYEAYNEADFTTSGISGYTPPLGTLSGPTAGEYSISQTANDRTIMKINGFVPTVKTWVYSFVIRIVDAAEGYLSVEQSGVQRSSTLRLITSELTTVSDTFTYDPASGPIVFKIYTGSLDPWNASWSSFTLGSYTASITAPLSAPLVATEISTMTIGTEILSFPLISSVNSEAWSVYAVSTMGNPSTLGGLLFQEATLGVGAYITGGVVGAKSFQFNTISGNAGKVVVTNGDQVMSTSISAGQLQYLTGLTSQAANSVTTGADKITQQYNATTGDISTLVNRATMDAALALVPNLLPLANTWTGSYNQFNGTVSTMGTNRFIQPYNALVTDVSTAVNRATLDASIAGLGAGILSLANTWTNTNTFQSTLTTAEGYTTSINGALSTILNDQGFTSASFTTAGITGAYTPPLGTITNPSGSTYQITQTAQGRSIMAISGFTPSVGITYLFEFNIKCTIGTATISVEQDNIVVSPALYQLSTGFNRVKGSFTYNGTPNTVVFKIYTGVASWNAQWDSFTLSTYSIGMNANMNALTVNNRFTQRYNALPGDVSTLTNRATLDSAVVAPFSAVSIGSVPYESATNTFSNSLITQGTTGLGYTGASFTASTGIASITFATPTYTANSNASVQGIINATALPTSVIGLPCIATFTALTFPLFATAPYPYFTLTNGATVVYTSAVGASGTITMPFTPTSTTLFITIFFKAPPTGVSVPVLTWTNFTITTPSMTTTGFNTTTGRQTVGSLLSDGSIVKRTTDDGSLARLAGGSATFSPYVEFLTAGTSRGYLGDCNASNMYIASENGATLNFVSEGALRMTIDSAGFTTLASKELRAATPVSAAGGQIRLTNGTSVGGYGNMLHNDGSNFRFLLTNNNDAFGNFNGLRPLAIRGVDGLVTMSNGLTVDGGNFYIVNNFTKQGGNSGANRFEIRGSDPNNSPYLEFFVGNTRRSYIGYATATQMDIVAENGARILLASGGIATTFQTNGNVLMNTPSAFGNGLLQITSIAGGNAQDAISCRACIDANYIIIFHNTGGAARGQIRGVNSSSVAYDTSSDRRLKDNIHTIENSLGIVNQLKPVHFRWKADDTYDFGFIAQEVYKVLPHLRPDFSSYIKDCSCKNSDLWNGTQCDHCLSMNDEPVDDEGKPKYYSLDYGKFTPYLVGAVQELKKQNDAQQKEIDELKELVRQLLAKA